MRNCSHKVSIALILTTVAATALAGGKRHKEVKEETQTEKIRAGVQYEFSRSLRAGRLVKAHDGVDGVITKTYRVTLVGGKAVDKELLKEDRKDPKPTIFLMGRGGMPSDRGSFTRKKVLEMSATAYDPGPRSNGGNRGRTRTGARAAYGVAAVDPRVIPLGSILFVEGYGLALACDTGSAIKGNRIDLCYDSKNACDDFGRQRVRVHVLGIR